MYCDSETASSNKMEMAVATMEFFLFFLKALILSKSVEAKLVMTHDLLLTRGRHASMCTPHCIDGAMNKRLLGSCPLQQSW